MRERDYYSKKFLQRNFNLNKVSKIEYINTFKKAWSELDNIGDGKRQLEIQQKYSYQVHGYKPKTPKKKRVENTKEST